MMRKVIIAIVITTADDCFIVSINQICKGPEMLNIHMTQLIQFSQEPYEVPVLE